MRRRQVREWLDHLECARENNDDTRRELVSLARSAAPIAWNTRVPPFIRVSVLPLVSAMAAALLLWPPGPGSNRSVSPTLAAVTQQLRSGFVTLSGSPPGNTAGQCWKYQGHARLRPGTTLLIGARRVNPPDNRTYYEKVMWSGDAGRSNWMAYRYFGSEAGQSYRVLLVAIAEKAADTAERDGRLPGDAEVRQLTPDVRRVQRAGAC